MSGAMVRHHAGTIYTKGKRNCSAGPSASPCLHVLAHLYFFLLFLISEALFSKKSIACSMPMGLSGWLWSSAYNLLMLGIGKKQVIIKCLLTCLPFPPKVGSCLSVDVFVTRTYQIKTDCQCRGLLCNGRSCFPTGSISTMPRSLHLFPDCFPCQVRPSDLRLQPKWDTLSH